MGKGRDRMKQKQPEKAAQAQPQQQQQVEPQKPKIGQGAFKAYLRQGAKEIAQVLPAFPSHGIQPVEEAGTIWGSNPTPQQVHEQQTQVKAEKQKQIEPGD